MDYTSLASMVNWDYLYLSISQFKLYLVLQLHLHLKFMDQWIRQQIYGNIIVSLDIFCWRWFGQHHNLVFELIICITTSTVLSYFGYIGRLYFLWWVVLSVEFEFPSGELIVDN